MTAALRPLFLAWQFLTVVPLKPVLHEPASEDLARSMVWYPVVGALIGVVLAGADWLFVQWTSRELSAALVILILVVTTGGLHQDGVADTFDGLAAGRTAADRLAIMRDPRIGAIGATALFLSLILRYAALLTLSQGTVSQALFCMPAVGRWAMVVCAYGAPYPRSEGGLAAPFLAHLSLGHVAGATGVLFGLLASGLGVVPALVILPFAGLLSRVGTAFFCRRFGGVTGDMLGTTNEMLEIVFLIVLPWLSLST